jgi:DNA invertase Pin-like site-specific DNA recombinase
MKKVAIYLRVSTNEQTTSNQRHALQEVADKSGWEIIEFYEDHGISGAKGKDQRPAYKRLQEDATRRKFDLVAVWSIDRLGRSLQDLVAFLNDIHALGIGLYMHKQAIDTTTATGKLLFNVCSVFAEFERTIIAERVKAGLVRAKANGKTLGRRKTDASIEKQIQLMLKSGQGILKTAKAIGVGTGTVQRIKNQMKDMAA